MGSDTRVPVVQGDWADLRPGDMLLASQQQHGAATLAGHAVLALPSAHAPGCDCCIGRDPWAEALGGLFVAMMRGEIQRFDRVVAILDEAETARLAALLAEDRLLAGRFRWTPKRQG